MKNNHDRKLENTKAEQEIKIRPSTGAASDTQNQNHNTKKVSMGPNTKR